MKAIPIITLIVLCGCARFRTVQQDTSTNEDGTQRTITTRASATTFAASKSTLASWKATQTDKTQGASVGGLTQESDATKLTEAIGAILLKGLAAWMTGGGSLLVPQAPTQGSAPATTTNSFWAFPSPP